MAPPAAPATSSRLGNDRHADTEAADRGRAPSLLSLTRLARLALFMGARRGHATADRPHRWRDLPTASHTEGGSRSASRASHRLTRRAPAAAEHQGNPNRSRWADPLTCPAKRRAANPTPRTMIRAPQARGHPGVSSGALACFDWSELLCCIWWSGGVPPQGWCPTREHQSGAAEPVSRCAPVARGGVRVASGPRPTHAARACVPLLAHLGVCLCLRGGVSTWECAPSACREGKGTGAQRLPAWPPRHPDSALRHAGHVPGQRDGPVGLRGPHPVHAVPPNLHPAGPRDPHPVHVVPAKRSSRGSASPPGARTTPAGVRRWPC